MEVKMEKEPDSIVVITKPEYAASEYSASSEPPPAYKLHQANSVKIAKIIAVTIILSSIILGSFMLASTYMNVKATCDQVSALDAVLDKELMLEAMQQDIPIPHSEALQSSKVNINTDIVQDLSKDEINKPNIKDETNPEDVEAINTDSDGMDDTSEMKRVHIRLPLDFDLSELAHNILMNNEKTRMNCVVERRRTEEIAGEKMQQVNPFNVFMDEPKKEKVTGERISIFCETGTPKIEQEPQVEVRRIVMPFPFPGRGPAHRLGQQFQVQQSVGPVSQFQQQEPLQFLGPQMGPNPFQARFGPQIPMNFPLNQYNSQHQMRPQFQPSFQHQQMPLPPIPAQMMSPPRPDVPQFRLISPNAQQEMPNFERQIEQSGAPQQQPSEAQPEVRIHLRRIQIPGPIGDILPFLNNNDIHKEIDTKQYRENVQMDQVPLAVALSKVGITPEDLRNIQRMAEEKFQEHIRELVAEEVNDSSSDSNSDSEEDTSEAITENQSISEQEKSKQKLHEVSFGEEQTQILSLGRSNFGRSLNPVHIPVPMTENAEIQEAERSPFVLQQPR